MDGRVRGDGGDRALSRDAQDARSRPTAAAFRACSSWGASCPTAPSGLCPSNPEIVAQLTTRCATSWRYHCRTCSCAGPVSARAAARASRLRGRHRRRAWPSWRAGRRAAPRRRARTPTPSTWSRAGGSGTGRRRCLAAVVALLLALALGLGARRAGALSATDDVAARPLQELIRSPDGDRKDWLEFAPDGRMTADPPRTAGAPGRPVLRRRARRSGSTTKQRAASPSRSARSPTGPTGPLYARSPDREKSTRRP